MQCESYDQFKSGVCDKNLLLPYLTDADARSDYYFDTNPEIPYFKNEELITRNIIEDER